MSLRPRLCEGGRFFPWDLIKPLTKGKSYSINDFLQLPRKKCLHIIQFSSVQLLSHVQLFGTPWSASRQPPCPSPTPGACSNSCPLSQWCHPTISSSVILFFSCLQSFPASGSFPMSHLFTSGGQSTGVSALASFLPKKSQGWSPAEWTGWISLQYKGLSRLFSNTTVQNHQFFRAQLSL